MAHIPDGVLSVPVLVGGAIGAACLLVVGIRRLDDETIPKTAVLAAFFFVASLVHIPVGMTSVHPLLTGLMGLVLGWAAVPAILVGLLLQAVFFGFGGITVLGVNTVNIAVPALLVAALLAPRLNSDAGRHRAWLIGAVAGFLGVALTAGMVAASLALSGNEYIPSLPVVVASYGFLAVVEAVITAAAVHFVIKVKPELILGEAHAHG